MSGKIVGEIFENAPTDLRTSEFLVLLSIGEDARDSSRLAQHSDVESLHYRTRIAPGTVRNALSVLVRRGLIVPTVATVHKGGKHQEYRVPRLQPYHRGE